MPTAQGSRVSEPSEESNPYGSVKAADSTDTSALNSAVEATRPALGTVYAVLFAISFSHLLNDTIQALLPAIYPMLANSYALTFTQLGLITFTFQLTASLLQPFVGFVTDRHPMPWSLAIGMCLTGSGLVSLAYADSFPFILLSAGLIGTGSSVFHPESSRVAFMAAGKRYGLAQSLFQVGGNAGTALGPLLAAVIVLKHGQHSLLWFFFVAMAGAMLLGWIGRWQVRNRDRLPRRKKDRTKSAPVVERPRAQVIRALLILVALTFSKFVYLESLKSYYSFYLMERFHLSERTAVLYLFVFLFAVAAGTIMGGPIGDKFGRKRVIWFSILGAAPFTLAMPHVGLGLTITMSVIAGLILASAFPAILVYAQEILPGKVGMVAGLFFGLAFGIAGIGSAVLGNLADHTSIYFVYEVCAFMPLIGLLAAFLPNIEREAD